MNVERAKRVILVDDLRSFSDGRNAEVARTSTAGLAVLAAYRDVRIDELWLDHDLGEKDTIWPVVEVLERVAFEGRPLDGLRMCFSLSQALLLPTSDRQPQMSR